MKNDARDVVGVQRSARALDGVELFGREVRVLEKPLAVEHRALACAVPRKELRQPPPGDPRGVASEARQPLLEQRGQVGPPARLTVQLFERGVRVGVVGVVVERAAEGDDRGVDVADVVPFDPADPVHQRSPPRRIRSEERGAIERHALRGASLVAKEAVDAREELARVRLVGERAAVERDRGDRVAALGERFAGLLRERAQLVGVDDSASDGPGKDGRAPLRIGARTGQGIEALEPFAERAAGADRVDQALRREIDGPRRVGRSAGEGHGVAQRREALVDVGSERPAHVEDAKERPSRVLAPVHRLEDARRIEAMVAARQELLERQTRDLLLRVEGQRLLERDQRGRWSPEGA